jgi:branched-chain amino acid aminotransferase
MSLVWLNGALLQADAARIDPADRGFTLGDGVFETLRADSGMAAQMARHLARLRRGAAVLGIEVSFSNLALAEAVAAVAGGADCAVRMTLTRGKMARGVLPSVDGVPTLLISASALPASAKPARVIVSRQTRRNEFSPLSRIKSLNYGDSIVARREAAAQGADDALLLNTGGDLAEATAANVILMIDGSWVTPRVEDGALPGIARGLLIESGKVDECTVTERDIERANSAVLINALGVRQVASIDGVALACLIDSAHENPAPTLSLENILTGLRRKS